MAMYDQIDAMPVFYSVCMIFEVIAGLTILDEAQRYSTSHLVGISIGVIITVIGILVLGNKKTLLAKDEEKKK